MIGLFCNDDLLVPFYDCGSFCFLKNLVEADSLTFIFRVPLHWIGFGYAALIASGGIIGYAKAGMVCSYLTS